MAEHQQINVWVQGLLSVHQMLIQQLCLLPAMSCRVEDRIYCKCKRINVKRKFFIFVSINIYACMEDQALHRYTCLHPLVLHINDSQESHANWYISHCVRMCFNGKLIPIPLLSCLHWVVDDWFLFICSFCSSSWGALQHPSSSHSALF